MITIKECMKTEKEKIHRISFEVDEVKHKKLKVLAALHGYSMKSLIDTGIDLVIEQVQKQVLEENNGK